MIAFSVVGPWAKKQPRNLRYRVQTHVVVSVGFEAVILAWPGSRSSARWRREWTLMNLELM